LAVKRHRPVFATMLTMVVDDNDTNDMQSFCFHTHLRQQE